MRTAATLLALAAALLLSSCDFIRRFLEPEVKPDTSAPAEVGAPRALGRVGLVRLDWTDPSDADFARVRVSGEGFDEITVDKGVEFARVDGLENGRAYEFRLRAEDAAGNKSAGVLVTATPQAFVMTSPDPEYIPVGGATFAFRYAGPAGQAQVRVNGGPWADAEQGYDLYDYLQANPATKSVGKALVESRLKSADGTVLATDQASIFLLPLGALSFGGSSGASDWQDSTTQTSGLAPAYFDAEGSSYGAPTDKDFILENGRLSLYGRSSPGAEDIAYASWNLPGDSDRLVGIIVLNELPTAFSPSNSGDSRAAYVGYGSNSEPSRAIYAYVAAVAGAGHQLGLVEIGDFDGGFDAFEFQSIGDLSFAPASGFGVMNRGRYGLLFLREGDRYYAGLGDLDSVETDENDISTRGIRIVAELTGERPALDASLDRFQILGKPASVDDSDTELALRIGTFMYYSGAEPPPPP